ncbi:MAG: ammonium transporter [Chloroflexi bacterium]|nr:ammonium transporter [Chloroflexota bacterium]MCL5275290.1 ammonium transporter [Chloroflexota bacterium]
MPAVNSGDTAWVLIATALVLMMTPALAFFYGGMVRKKNILSTLNLNMIVIALVSVQWILIGYSLAFGPSNSGLIGSLAYLGFNGVGSAPNAAYAPTIPHMAYAGYQMTFAIITPALITGAFVERVRFKTFVVFILLWSTLVYGPVAHWVWGDGGLFHNLGVLDFAGGTVVHVTAGFSALTFAWVIGPRKGYGSVTMEPSNIPFTVLGAGLLWMGWFGFNGGSALAAGGLAANAILTTNTAAAAAGLVWMLLSWRDSKPSVLGIVTGMVVGLVAITPASGFVTPLAALVIGGVAALISYNAIKFRQRLKLDESLDVWACHGMGGLWGALATGLFASKAINPAGADGLLYGNPGQFLVQALTVVVVIIFSMGVTFIITKALNRLMGLRVSPNAEEVGLDISEHGEHAYS